MTAAMMTAIAVIHRTDHGSDRGIGIKIACVKLYHGLRSVVKLYRGMKIPKMPVKGTKFSGVDKDENIHNYID